MEFLNSIKSAIPDYAKDIRLNLDAVITRSSLPPSEALGAALAVACAARSRPVIRRHSRQRPAARGRHPGGTDRRGADGHEQRSQRADLRMNVYAVHGGGDRRRFELYALAASIVGKCRHCVGSHYALLRESGMTDAQLRDAGWIAAVVAAAAGVLAMEGPA